MDFDVYNSTKWRKEFKNLRTLRFMNTADWVKMLTILWMCIEDGELASFAMNPAKNPTDPAGIAPDLV